MRRIKLYFITYKNNAELRETLKSVPKSGIKNYDYEINIVNNSPSIPIDFEIEDLDNVRVIENQTRPEFSTGHLSRNWNECLIDGFRSLKNPDCDIVVLCQNDLEFNPDVFDKIVEKHKEFDFITYGAGDAYHSYTVDSVRKVGLWDERFCAIGCHDGDYFIRNVIANPERSSINDSHHGRVHKPLDFEILDEVVCHPTKRRFKEGEEIAREHSKWGRFMHKVYRSKWPDPARNWPKDVEKTVMQNPQPILYPYFELEK